MPNTPHDICRRGGGRQNVVDVVSTLSPVEHGMPDDGRRVEAALIFLLLLLHLLLLVSSPSSSSLGFRGAQQLQHLAQGGLLEGGGRVVRRRRAGVGGVAHGLRDGGGDALPVAAGQRQRQRQHHREGEAVAEGCRRHHPSPVLPTRESRRD